MCQVDDPVNPVTTSEPSRGARRVLHVLGRPPADAFGLAVAPNVRRQHRLMTLVDGIADRLAHEVVADGPAAEIVTFDELPAAGAVVGVAHGLRDVEVVAPTGELQPVEAPAPALLGELIEG